MACCCFHRKKCHVTEDGKEVFNMRERLARFMAGRYGMDQLNKVYLGITLVLLVISMFSHLAFFYMAGIVLLVYTYYRMFSKNISKMYAQNQKFLNARYRMAVRRDRRIKQREQQKIYHFYHCPSCKQKVRVPRGKGRICITCPKCKTEFVKKS